MKVFRWGRGVVKKGGVLPSKTLVELGVREIACGSKTTFALSQANIVFSLELNGEGDYTPTVSLSVSRILEWMALIANMLSVQTMHSYT